MRFYSSSGPQDLDCNLAAGGFVNRQSHGRVRTLPDLPSHDVIVNTTLLPVSFEEVMDYRTYCETIAGLLQKPIAALVVLNLKVCRNVK